MQCRHTCIAAHLWADAWDAVGCRTAASAGPRWQLVCMAASARTWLLFVLVVVSVPLPILVQASVGWCTPCLGCLHGLVCLYQIKLNNVKQSSKKAQNKAQNQGRGARGSPRAGPPMEKEGGVRSARSGKDLHACPHTTQRLTGLNCLPLCVAVLGAPHVICDHAAAAAPVAGCICTPVASAVRITVIRRIRGVHATGTVDPAMTREKEDHGHR